MRKILIVGIAVTVFLVFLIGFYVSQDNPASGAVEWPDRPPFSRVQVGSEEGSSGSVSRLAPPPALPEVKAGEDESAERVRGLLNVPPSYPFDPNAPLPGVEFSSDGRAMTVLTRAIQDDRGGVNPLRRVFSEERLKQFCEQLTPEIEVHQALIKDLMKAQGLAAPSFKPVLGRTFASEEEAQRFGERVFGSYPELAIRRWGIWDHGGNIGTQNYSVYFIDPNTHVDYYKTLEQLAEADKLLRNRILTLTLTSEI